MVTCNMCIPVKVKNVPPKSGTADQGFPEGVILSAMSRVHSWACSTVKAAPKNMVASSQLRTHGLSQQLADIKASTIIRKLERKKDVMIETCPKLFFANDDSTAAVET